MLNKAILIVLDSAGVGNAPDAALYGDEGANTIGHIAEKTGMTLPNMQKMGLGHIEGANLSAAPDTAGAFGRMTEASSGKDTTTTIGKSPASSLPRPSPPIPTAFPPK